MKVMVEVEIFVLHLVAAKWVPIWYLGMLVEASPSQHIQRHGWQSLL